MFPLGQRGKIESDIYKEAYKLQAEYKEIDDFDLTLAIECASSFSNATGLGCTISDVNGDILHEAGHGCDSCQMCAIIGERPENCTQTHIYGMTEAERFGGKYIYFCPVGLSCFVSPIVGQVGSAAKITVGPFSMVDWEDYVAYDLQTKLQLDDADIARVKQLFDAIPYIPPGKVHALSNLLFMSVGFLNNVSAVNRMRETQSSDMISGQISAYIQELKKQEDEPQYPLDTEQALIASITHPNLEQAQKLLNELLGFILFSSSGNLYKIKSRIYELLVVMSRAAVEAGASPEQSYERNHDYFVRSMSVNSIEDLYSLINDAMKQTIDSVFRDADIKHMDVIHKAVNYVQNNYHTRITLEDIAEKVYLSSSYFSKVFKTEMGCSFNTYLNRVRIEKSKKLLLGNLRMAEIATMVGFEDQSYFTKVFKRVVGISPNRYREIGGRV